MRLLLTGVSAAALASLIYAPAAVAQEQQGGTTERGADEITCHDISTMDTALVPGVLYFIAGHREGARGAAPGPDGTNDTTTGQPETDEAEDEAAQDGPETDAAATQSDQTQPPEATQPAPDAAAAEAPEAVQVVRVRGHFEIPIERTIIACAETPDALAGDVVDQQRTGASPDGGGTAGSPGDTGETGENGDAQGDDSGEPNNGQGGGN